MAAIIELKYFNTFWLKKLKDVTDIVPESNTSITYVSNVGKTFQTGGGLNTGIGVGQQVTIQDGPSAKSKVNNFLDSSPCS